MSQRDVILLSYIRCSRQLSAVTSHHFQVCSSFFFFFMSSHCWAAPVHAAPPPTHPPASFLSYFSAEACEYMNDNSMRVTAKICRHRHCPRAGFQAVPGVGRRLVHKNPRQSRSCKHFVPAAFALFLLCWLRQETLSDFHSFASTREQELRFIPAPAPLDLH